MLTVFTAIFGKTYKLQPPEYRGPNVRYLCFTDDPKNTAAGVETVIVEPKSETPELAAKWHKWHPPTGDTLYLDSAYQLLVDPTPWLIGLGGDVGLCEHGHRRCCYYEAKTIEKYRPDESAAIVRQCKRYLKAGLPMLYGLWEGGIIFRRAGHKRTEAWNEMVWSEIQEGSIRDQLAIPYCVWKTKLVVDTLPSRMPDMVRQHRALT